MDKVTREMTFEEEAAFYEKEARAEFAKETGNGDCSKVNGILRRGMRIIRKAREEIANGVTVQDSKPVEIDQFKQWISVKDGLPDKDGKYLVCKNLFGDSCVSAIRFAKDGRKVSYYDFENRWKNVWYEYDSEYGHFTVDTVTHWMPLPELPKEE